MSWAPLVQRCIQIALEAGAAIEQNALSLEIEHKLDDSPVTNADLAADKIIHQGLLALSDIGHLYPILSEESEKGFKCPQGRYWCVDPLDGTRDFIHKTGDYTVNIALMENQQPILGVVHAPHSSVTYYASPDGGAKLCGHDVSPLHVRALDVNNMTALVSRFHPNKNLVRSLEDIEGLEILPRGSAIKFCEIAQGCADIYPRLTPCRNWDIAAAHCVLRAAGGEIFDMQLNEFVYKSKAPWLIQGLFAVSDKNYDWSDLISKLPNKN